MTEAAHTEGPWYVYYGNKVGPNDRSIITTCDGSTAREAQANARLIAEAGTVAHETGLTPRQLAEQRGALLKALEAIQWFCDDPHGSESRETLAEGLARLLPAARAAVAKAKGVSHD